MRAVVGDLWVRDHAATKVWCWSLGLLVLLALMISMGMVVGVAVDKNQRVLVYG